MLMAVDGQAFPLLPALHCPDVALEKGGDLFPRLKPLLDSRLGRLAVGQSFLFSHLQPPVAPGESPSAKSSMPSSANYSRFQRTTLCGNPQLPLLVACGAEHLVLIIMGGYFDATGTHGL